MLPTTIPCCNCETGIPFPIPPGTLTLSAQRIEADDHRYQEVIGYLCNKCQENVLTAKIVIKRTDPKQPFVFEQYLPVESQK